MCLNGQLETMIEVLNALNDAKLQVNQWRADNPNGTAGSVLRPINVSYDEGIELLIARIFALEAKCRELGIHGPAPKADTGDSVRIVSAK